MTRWTNGPLLATVGLAFAAIGFACATSNAVLGSYGYDAGADEGGSTFSTTDASSDSVNGPCVTCSVDLHQVLDCDGGLIQTCADTEACGPQGTCISPCDSASFNKSSYGCDFYAFESDDSHHIGSCYAAFVANTWPTPVTIQVDRAGAPLDVTSFARIPVGSGPSLTYEPLPSGQLPAGQVAILFLAHQETNETIPGERCPPNIDAPGAPCLCPVTPAWTQGNPSALNGGQGLGGSARGDAFHIRASAPVVAYDIWPYGGGGAAVTGASLLLPTSAWGTNYVSVDPNPEWTTDADDTSTTAFIAQEDGTQVTVRSKYGISGSTGVPGAAPGASQTYTLAKGEVVQLAPGYDGSFIQSTKPIAVWASAAGIFITPGDHVSGDNTDYADSAHQQLPPIQALGHEYVAVSHRPRVSGASEAPPWRVVAVVDGTTFSYDPSPPVGAPAVLSAGQSVTFYASAPFVVTSQDAQHPFYMSAHMTGCSTRPTNGDLGPEGCAGDPEFMNVVPSDEFLKRYVFFTDPTYPETDLVIVRRKSALGFQDVSLDCGGVLKDWTPIGTSGQYEFQRLDLSRHNFEPQGGCDNGRHEMKSDGTFGVSIWGWGTRESGVETVNYPDMKCPDGGVGSPYADVCWGSSTQYVSYGFAAGMSVKPINTVVVPTIK